MRGGLTSGRAALGFAALFAAGCGASPSAITVALRVPAGDSPLALADHVTLSIRDAEGAVLALTRAATSASSITSAAVPPGSGYVVELDARLGSDLVAHGRSCAFELTAGRPAPKVPVYFSRVGAFAAADFPSVARSSAVLFPLHGAALLAGGAAGGPALASSDVYDPATGQFAAGPTLTTPRASAEAAVLADGTVLVFGGAAPGAAGIDVLSAGHFAPSPVAFPPELLDEASVVLGDGRVLVAGGRVAASTTRSSSLLLSQDGALLTPGGPLQHARRLHTLTLAGPARASAVLAIGGVDATGPVAAVELFDPDSDSFSLAGIDLATPRSEHSATLLPDGRVLVAGGRDASGRALASVEIYDPIKRQMTPTGALKMARAQHVAVLLPSNRVLIAGGLDASGAATATAEIFDPSLGPSGDFVPTSPMTTARAGHSAAPLCDGTLLFAGGGAGAEIYNPVP